MTSSHAIPLPVLLSDLANKQWQRLLERADAEQQSGRTQNSKACFYPINRCYYACWHSPILLPRP